MGTFFIGLFIGIILGFAIFYGVCKLIARVERQRQIDEQMRRMGDHIRAHGKAKETTPNYQDN